MRQAFVDTLTTQLDAREDVALVLADIGAARFEAAKARHPDRVINVGIREALGVGLASGLALEGLRPVFHTYAPFLVERAFEQIKLDLVHQALPATLVSIGASYDASIEGRTHQAPGDVALLSALDLRIETPGHRDEVAPALERGLSASKTTYVRLSERSNAAPYFEPVNVLRRGSRGTVIVLGPLLDASLEAARALDLGVVYCPTSNPLPAELRDVLAGSAPLALVEPVLEGSSEPALRAVLGPRVVHTLGVPRGELRRYGSPADHEAAHGLDAAGLTRRLSALAEQPASLRAQHAPERE